MALFVVGSTTHLQNASPGVIAAPLTVGCWFKLNSVPATASFVWGFGNTSLTETLNFNANASFGFNCSSGGTNANMALGTPATGVWYFGLCRANGVANRRLDVLQPAGDIISTQNTTSLAPTLNLLEIGDRALPGGRFPFDGHIAEWFLMNADVQADGLATQDSLVRQIAYKGIFSVPHAIKNIVEYRSLNTLGSEQDSNTNDVYFGGGVVRQTWVNTGVIRNAPSPYVMQSIRPGQTKAVLAV